MVIVNRKKHIEIKKALAVFIILRVERGPKIKQFENYCLKSKENLWVYSLFQKLNRRRKESYQQSKGQPRV